NTPYLERLDDEQANLRAALEWGLEEDPALALRLAGALGSWWLVRGRWREGCGLLEAALERGQSAAPAGAPPGSTKALKWLRWLLYRLGNLERAHALAQESLELCLAAGDRVGVGDALNDLG